MTSCDLKVQESNTCSVHKAGSHLVFSICWNLKEAGSTAGEGLDVLARQEQAGSVSLCRLPAEGVAPIKGVTSRLKIRIKDVFLWGSGGACL